MIQNHRAVSTVDERGRIFRRADLGGEQLSVLEESCDVCVPLAHMRLASRKMAVDEAERCVVDNEAGNDAALK